MSSITRVRPLTVLVADDDPDLRDILRSILQPNGFRVLEASDGAVALETTKAERPDLLILDYMMPRMDGPHVCQFLKHDLLLRHVPIIMLTGRGDTSDKVYGMEAGADDYLVKPFEPQELLARVRTVLRRTTQELEANPLTKLPGNISIHKELETRLATRVPLAVCYCDLNQFKAFNDHYGFERGDRVIIRTASILLAAAASCGGASDFIGHIGGDDFVLVTTPERAEPICEEVIRQFDAMAPSLYDEADRQQGYIMHMDRSGKLSKVGLLSIAIAVVSSDNHDLRHMGQIAKLGAELKTLAKQSPTSIYVRERRGK